MIIVGSLLLPLSLHFYNTKIRNARVSKAKMHDVRENAYLHVRIKVSDIILLFVIYNAKFDFSLVLIGCVLNVHKYRKNKLKFDKLKASRNIFNANVNTCWQNTQTLVFLKNNLP